MARLTWSVAAVLVLVVPAGGGTSRRSGIPEQIPTRANACLHGAMEQPPDRLRRDQALTTMRAIHAAQERAVQQMHQYKGIAALQPLAIPEAFRLESYVGASGYFVVLKDGRDPCGFAMFSDESGLVYEVSPRNAPHPE